MWSGSVERHKCYVLQKEAAAGLSVCMYTGRACRSCVRAGLSGGEERGWCGEEVKRKAIALPG